LRTETIAATPATPTENHGSRWYAIRTRSRHEKVAAEQLRDQGIESFLPLVSRLRRWSDRQKEVELPLFPGYAFVRFEPMSADRLRVLRTHGVVGFVGPRWEATPVPDSQIRDIKLLLGQKVPLIDHSFLQIGQRVRVKGGALDGVEGILSSHDGGRSLVITVEPIERSLSIRIEGYEVDVVK
jgi:transcription antitermination factor NusG